MRERGGGAKAISEGRVMVVAEGKGNKGKCDKRCDRGNKRSVASIFDFLLPNSQGFLQQHKLKTSLVCFCFSGQN